MKNIKLSFKMLKQRMLIFAMILIALLFPEQVYSEGQVGLRALITAIGVDKIEQGYEVSAQIFTPSRQPTSKKDIISERGPTVGSIMEALIIKTGRLGIENTCALIIFGPELAKDNVMETIDYFLRKNIISWSAVVAIGEKSALETLKGLNKLEERSPIDWSDFLSISEKGFDRAPLDLRHFAKGIYGLTNTAHTVVIGIEETEDEQSQNSGGQSGSGGGQGGEEEQSSQTAKLNGFDSVYTQSGGGNKEPESSGTASADKKSLKGQAPQIKMNGKTAVFVKGKQVLELNKEQTEGYNWIDNKAQYHHFMIEGLGGYYFGDAKLTIQVTNKKCKIKSKFDNKPEITFNISSKMALAEVMRDQIPLIVGKDDTGALSKKLVDEVQKYIKDRVLDAYYTAAEKGADIFNLVPHFYKFHTKQYNSYMTGGRTMKDLLHDIDIKFKFKIEIEV
ncbi:MAG TPA: Ger(x)C family spore germination C-terminal domain-containing protein [Clostridia bacterium]